MLYIFGECALDTHRYELSRAGRVRPLRRKVCQFSNLQPRHQCSILLRRMVCRHPRYARLSQTSRPLRMPGFLQTSIGKVRELLKSTPMPNANISRSATPPLLLCLQAAARFLGRPQLLTRA
jgi:hypothetical protein